MMSASTPIKAFREENRLSEGLRENTCPFCGEVIVFVKSNFTGKFVPTDKSTGLAHRCTGKEFGSYGASR